jgi:hypothetical protein
VLEACVLTAAVGLSLVGVLNRPAENLDASWQMMLIHAHQTGLQFGRDIIFTWGPWGFLCTNYSLGGACAAPIIAWQTAGQFALAFALVWLVRPLALWRRYVFFAAFICLGWLFQDTAYFVLIAIVVLMGLMRPGTGGVAIASWSASLGFLAQIKFTYFVLTAGGVCAAAALWLMRGDRRRAAAVAAAYALGVPAFWALGGQGLDNLYPYVMRSLEIASGYGDAMGFNEPMATFLWGAAVILGCAAYVRVLCLEGEDRRLGLCGGLFLALSLLLVWKESYTRADHVGLGGHVFGLFGYVGVMAPAAGAIFFPSRRWHWFDLATIFCGAAIVAIEPSYIRLLPRMEWERAYAKARVLGRIASLPADWRSDLAAASQSADLPRIRAAVGGGTVDVYNYSVGTALLNGLKLSARPIFQSYSAYTPSLEGWNLRRYQSPRAPDFLLWRNESVDGRYPGQDDALLVSSLPGHYQPEFEENGYWLFRRKTAAGPLPARRLILQETVRLGDEVRIPGGTSGAIWLDATPVPDALGRMRALLYKPAEIYIETLGPDGTGLRSRLVPRVDNVGFILDPVLDDGRRLADLMNGSARRAVRAFRFWSTDGQNEYWSRVDVQLFDMPSLKCLPAGGEP